MPTIIAHSVFAVSLAHVFKHTSLPLRFWVLALGCSMLPDIDVIGFSLGVKYGEFWGHRGFSHSLTFALATSLLVVLLAFYQEQYRPLRLRLVVFFFLVTASHGLFDAMTNDFLEWGGWRVLSNEFKWIVLPSLALLLVSIGVRYWLMARRRA